MIKKVSIVILALVCLAFAVSRHKAHAEQRVEMEVANTVTRLLSPDGIASGGTGFEVKSSTGEQYTMTNAHVCGLGRKKGYLLAVPTYGPVAELKILKVSDKTDLCLLEPIKDMPALEFAKRDLHRGDAFFLEGHPLLRQLTLSEGRVIVSAITIDVLEGYITSEEEAQACTGPRRRIVDIFFGIVRGCVVTVKSQETTAKVYPGNSGSPIVDYKGKVRGILFASGSKGRPSFIVPLHDLKGFVKEYEQAH